MLLFVVYVVPVTGVEPAYPKATHFECVVYSVPPHWLDSFKAGDTRKLNSANNEYK